MAEVHPPIVALVRLAVEHVAADPVDEQRYLELNFAVDRAVEQNLRYRELLQFFEAGAHAAPPEAAWAWRLAAGLSANLMGDTQAAVRLLEAGRFGLEFVGKDHTAIASFLLGELARACYHQADHQAGIEAATQALQLARAVNSPLAEAYAHHYLGLISTRRRDFEYARRHVTRARDLFERMNQRLGRARVLDSLAALEMEEGRYQEARALLEESLGVKEHLHDLRGQALTCGNLARLSAVLGEYRLALHYLDRERALTSRVGDERNATQVRIQLGELHLRHGEPELARVELNAAIDLARQRQDLRADAHACFALAEAERRLGHRELALEAIERAASYFTSSDDAVMRDRSLIRQALLNGSDLDSPAVQEPLDRLRGSNASGPLAQTLFEVASNAHNRNRTLEATTLYAESLDVAEPTLADQLAALMRQRAESAEGRAWVDAMLTVKEQKDRLEHAYSELQHAENLRESLTQMIVHDLKNPLTAITPWLETIQMGGLTQDETSEYLQTVIDECGYLLRMIDDLNDIGKMQHEGRIDLTREPLDLPDLLAEVTSRLQGRARENRMSIRLEPVPPLIPVDGDSDKLRRVLENLVANAIKYGRPPEESGRTPEVVVSAQVETSLAEGEGPSVRVAVQDFGEGIPLAEAERVFEPYYQAEAGRRRKAGVGLGLAFCRMVVEAHGGSIWTEPNPGGGTIFAFRLPAHS